jgi:soluble lytic murein transglycosylase
MGERIMHVTKRSGAAWILPLAAPAILAAGAALAAPEPLPRPAAAAAAPVTTVPADGVHPIPLPRKRPVAGGTVVAQAAVGPRGALFASRATIKSMVRPVAGPFAIAATTVTSDEDMAALKRVLEAARKGRDSDADAAQKTITDPVARKLAEWMILRSHNTRPGFERYADFIKNNPDWPHVPLFRRRAENALWNDGVDNDVVVAFFDRKQPLTAKGAYMLARVLLAKGDKEGAARLVRHAWRYQDCSEAVESQVLDQFGDIITRADHKIRMEKRFFEDDIEAGMRAARRLGGADLAIANARTAVIRNKSNALAVLNDVPVSARHDAGYIFARATWLRQKDKPDEAAKVLADAPKDPELLVDTDAWWQERRLIVRDLLDKGDPKAAFRVANDAAVPASENYRAGKYFLAGWVALRYLNDAKTAASLFAHVGEGTDNPHAISRGGYWQGRALEALGRRADAKKYYERAARHSATYYGQLARGRLGLKDLGLVGPPDFTAEERKVLENLEVVRAAKLLYALDERDMLASVYAEIGESGTDIAGMSMLGELAASKGDGRSMVLLGRFAHGRGLPMDYYAYPVIGLPDFEPIAPPVEKAMVYSIARQESHFNQHVVSSANAMGLMQVTPIAGKDTARRFKVTYSRSRLLKDPVYNMQFGAAELSWLYHYYDSYILTFAAYNAGFGRVRGWIAAYGDPRDPKVDPVDWVERLPFSETRNYVMRIMENLQVYRARFGGSTRLLIEADLHRGAAAK